MWKWSLQVLKDTVMKARVCGVQAMMPNFSFPFGCSLGEQLLKQTDNLSRALQDSTISTAEGYSIAQLVIKTLSEDRNDDCFNLFWERLLARKNELGSNNPELPRKWKLPVWWDSDRQQTYHFHDNALYQQLYYEAFDKVINSILHRFDQPDFRKYIHLQNIFLNAIKGDSWKQDLEEILKIYGENFQHSSLEFPLSLPPSANR